MVPTISASDKQTDEAVDPAVPPDRRCKFVKVAVATLGSNILDIDGLSKVTPREFGTRAGLQILLKCDCPPWIGELQRHDNSPGSIPSR
jgi:hypothetical protein